MAAPTLIAFAEAHGAVASGTNITTASLSWQTSDVIIVVTGTEGGSGGETQNTPTTTGSGVTLTQQQKHDSTGTDAGAGCWAAVASANSSGTFSFNFTNLAQTRNIHVGVYIFRGSAGIGNSNISTGSGRTVSLTATAADGSIVWTVVDWAAAAVQSFTPAATSHSNVSPGPTASPFSLLITGASTYYIGELDDQTSAGAVSYGIGGSGTGPFTIIAIEAKTGAGGAVVIPNIAMAPMIPGGNR